MYKGKPIKIYTPVKLRSNVTTVGKQLYTVTESEKKENRNLRHVSLRCQTHTNQTGANVTKVILPVCHGGRDSIMSSFFINKRNSFVSTH